MNARPCFAAALAAAVLAPPCYAQEPAADAAAEAAPEPVLVSRDVGDPIANGWHEGKWTTAGGSVEALDERPDDPAAPKGAAAMRVTFKFAPSSFGGWHCDPADGALPGKPRRLTVWTRNHSGQWWGVGVNFADADGNKFGLAIGSGTKDTKDWVFCEREFPTTVKNKEGKEVPIVYPIRLVNIEASNWLDRGNPNPEPRVWDFYDLRVHTDVSETPPEERPYSIGVSFPTRGNVFHAGEETPRVRIAASSWIGEERTIRVEATVEDARGGAPKLLKIPDLKVLDGAAVEVPLPDPSPGSYTVRVKATGFPQPYETTARCAVALHPRDLTAEEKRASPYGLNIHSGDGLDYAAFAKLGFVWVRDYAFNFWWMVHARGEGTYAGWPWYPKILRSISDNGFLALPCLMGGICYSPESKDPTWPYPTHEWRTHLGRIVSTFDEMPAWELDNERDAHVWASTDNYAEYHRAFGAIVKAVNPDAWAVQEGSAGIYVDVTEQHVLDGSYRDLDVVNGHRYCGVDGPEYSKSNLNTGRGEEKKMFLRDVFRHWKKAACADGKTRQCWVTEWGWDTLAGQIVTEEEQAAYMQREWVLAMGNGVEKMFWYWDYDTNTATPSAFFDGCGIFNRFREPKPVAPAFAALRTFLPAGMEYLGYADLGPNHMAHVLRCEGRLVALAFKIRKDGPDLEIRDPRAREVRDMYGKALKSGRRMLGIAPTWYLGLDEGCDWLAQCPLDLESDFYVRNVSGEPIEVRPVAGEGLSYEIALPPEMEKAGWTAHEVDGGYDVVGPVGLARGAARFEVVGRNGKVEKRMPVEIDVVPQAFAKSYATAFDGSFSIDVVNQSATNRTFAIRPALPDGWKVEPAERLTGDMAPDAKTNLAFRLLASTAIPAGETEAIPRLLVINPAVTNLSPDGLVIDAAPIIPRAWELARIDPAAMKMDGDLSDWPDAARLPSWMLGPYGDKESSRFWFAYAPEGFYLAMDIADSRCDTSDPRAFWRAADCLELEIGAPGATFAEGDYYRDEDFQFWMCPIAAEKRVYVGNWPRTDWQRHEFNGGCKPKEYAIYDLPDVKTGLVRTETGFRAEVFLPKERINGWDPTPGKTIGLAFTMNVQGARDPRQIYWPASKWDKAIERPWMWAKVKLGK